MPSPINIKNVFESKLFKRIVSDKVIRGRTQEFLPVAEVANNIVFFKDGGAAIVMESSSLNFGLLSEQEQKAVILAFAALLNSLSFSIEIVIRSQVKDISNYLNYLNDAFTKITNPKLKAIATDYVEFVGSSIKKKNVLGKTFYIVLPLTALELGIGKTVKSAFNKGPLPYPRSYVLKKAATILYPRRDFIVTQGRRLGVELVQLTNERLVNLLYKTFNPEAPGPKGEGEENVQQEKETK